jgi:hypothetical protein
MTGERTTIQVAVYWPAEGYGIPKRVASLDEARATAAEWVRQGYNSGKSRIHIIETTRKCAEWTSGTGKIV